MKPEKMTVLEVFQRERRLCVPLFQRAYVWNSEQQWEPLWEDIVRQANMHMAQTDPHAIRIHFLGAIVINIASVQGRSVARADVIDGQQRLTTLQLFMAALRDVAKAHHADPDDIDTFTRHTENPIRDKTSEEVFKVWPTNSDRRAFGLTMRSGSLREVLERFGPKADLPRIPAAYAFFYDAITDYVTEVASADGRKDRIFALRRALQGSLQLVVIELEPGDDPQMIFETLNARGQPLLPSDLIRNFVFMRAAYKSEKESELLYATYWAQFDEALHDDGRNEKRFWHQDERQGRLVRPRIDLFVNHYLTMKTERDIRIGHLFEDFRSWWQGEDSDVATFLADLRRYATLYRDISLPTGSDRMSILTARLSALDTSTVHPLLLYLAGLDDAALPQKGRNQIAEDLESYLVRRFVAGMTPKNYNRFFLALLTKAKHAIAHGDDLAETIRAELLRSVELTSIWPDDAAFRRGWLANPVYVGSRSDRSAMLLNALNAAMITTKNEKVVLMGLTVEHLLPQNGRIEDYPYAPMPKDEEDVSPEARRKRLLHTVGNLTLLTGPLNSSISNGPFSAKRTAIVDESDLRLNAWMRTDARTTWGETDILQRGADLFERAAMIWPVPRRRIPPVDEGTVAISPG
jgi:uncharacterized protein with ParB-like and HNH nuclease domain